MLSLGSRLTNVSLDIVWVLDDHHVSLTTFFIQSILNGYHVGRTLLVCLLVLDACASKG